MKKYLIAFALAFVAALTAAFALAGCSEDKQQLAAPTNFRLEGRTLIWDEVEQATAYDVFVEDVEHITQSNSFDLSFLYSPETYHIEVLAMGDNVRYTNSGWSQYTFVAEEILESGYDEQGYYFTLCEDGQSYEVSRGRSDLTGEITIPSYFCGLPVTHIASWGFTSSNVMDGNKSYPNTTAINFPSHLQEIGICAFRSYISIKELVFPDSVTALGMSAFEGCVSLNTVKLPKDIIRIERDCFYSCSLTDLQLPDGVQYIGMYAFSYGNPEHVSIAVWNTAEMTYKKVVLPASVKYFYDAFNCPNVEEIEYLGDVKNLTNVEPSYLNNTSWWQSQPDGFVYLNDMLIGYKGEFPQNTSLTISSDRTTVLAGNAFYGIEDITGITIESGIQLNAKALGGIPDLNYVNFPSGITYIPEYFLSGCTSLEEIEIPSTVTVIGSGAFSGCSALKKVIIPYGVQEINSYTFAHCSSLEEIEIPSSVKTLGNGVFYGCSSLKKISIPSGITELPQSLFFECVSLESVNLSSGLVSIGNEAFYRCYALVSITIPDGVQIIGAAAFTDTHGLKEIIIPASVKEFGYGMFRTSFLNFVPEGLEYEKNINIFYEGTAEEWEELNVDMQYLDQGPERTITVYTYSGEVPQGEGNFWHYAEDGITPVIW